MATVHTSLSLKQEINLSWNLTKYVECNYNHPMQWIFFCCFLFCVFFTFNSIELFILTINLLNLLTGAEFTCFQPQTESHGADAVKGHGFTFQQEREGQCWWGTTAWIHSEGTVWLWLTVFCAWSLGLVRFHDSPTPSSLLLQISLRPAQSFILNKKQVQKLSPQMTMNPAQGSGQVIYSNLIKRSI